MSRSYKKHPIYTDGKRKTTKESKRMANSKVRQNVDSLPIKGCSYKKIYDSYDIHDYVNRWTWEDAKREYENEENEYLKRHYPTLKDYYRYWLSICKSK